MKAEETGFIRTFDEQGRICFPVECRRDLGIKEGDPVKILTKRTSDGYEITLKSQNTIKNFESQIETMIENVQGQFGATLDREQKEDLIEALHMAKHVLIGK